MPDFRRFWKIVNPKWIVWFNDRFAVNKNKFIIQKRFVWYLAFTVVKKTQGKHTIYANKCDRKYFVKKTIFFLSSVYFFLSSLQTYETRSVTQKRSSALKHTIETNLKFASHTMFRREQVNLCSRYLSTSI